MRAKLIFNPSAGAARASPIEIVDVIHEMQAWNLIPEAYLVEPGSDLPQVVEDALARGIRMFVVCGGDGTICVVARTLAGVLSRRATLGIIPIGTQNDTALSLGIPDDLAAAIAILRTGYRTRVDVGMAACPRSSSEGGEISTPFLQACSVGLASELYPSADDVQHGNLARVGDLVTALVKSSPAEIRLVLDGKQEVHSLGHVVLVSNMPYIGRHYKVGSSASFGDGLLDVLFFADLSKLELLSYVFQGVGTAKSEDPRIQHYRVRRVDIDTQPAMQIMADGDALGEGRVRIEVRRHALAVMAAKQAPEELAGPEEALEAQTHAATG
jgi:diacylglycerol kinase (ATP)